MIAILGKFVNPYQPFGSITIRLEPKMTATMKEMENFCNRYVKTLRLKVNSEGKFVIEIQTI
jgi:hypothetical protein